MLEIGLWYLYCQLYYHFTYTYPTFYFLDSFWHTIKIYWHPENKSDKFYVKTVTSRDSRKYIFVTIFQSD